TAVKSGALSAKWNEDGSSFEYAQDGKLFRYDIKSKAATEIGEAPKMERRRPSGPARGRQFDSAVSPDGTFKAFTKDRNMYLSKPDGSDVIALTADGNEETQVKYGIAPWVHGEELSQNTAIGWGPDRTQSAFYIFQEKEAKK